MPALLAFLPGTEAAQTLRRTLPAGGPWKLVPCRTVAQLERGLAGQLVDAVIFSPLGPGTSTAALAPLRERFPAIPWIACHPFRADDGAVLLDCEAGRAAAAVVLGVDDAVAGELVVRHSAAAERRRLLADAPRMLRLTDPLQRGWQQLLDRVDEAVRTADLAERLDCSREHLSRQFGAGGAPNLKRVIDLTRVAWAAALLRNPGHDPAAVARILRFATPSHLSATARRIAGVPAGGLAALGPRGVLQAFVRGKTRSRL